MIPKGAPCQTLAWIGVMIWVMVCTAITTVLQPVTMETWFALAGKILKLDAKWNLTCACQAPTMAMDGILPQENSLIVWHSAQNIATTMK